MTIAPLHPEHADKTEPIPGADPRLTTRRVLVGYGYPKNGNVHNPKPRYVWLLQVDGRTVDQDSRRGVLRRAARMDGAEYLAEVDRTEPITLDPAAIAGRLAAAGHRVTVEPVGAPPVVAVRVTIRPDAGRIGGADGASRLVAAHLIRDGYDVVRAGATVTVTRPGF
jgi:hypothetical protein